MYLVANRNPRCRHRLECPACHWMAYRIASQEVRPCPRCGGVVSARLFEPGELPQRVHGGRPKRVHGYFTAEQLAELEAMGKPSRVVEKVVGDFLAYQRLRRMAEALSGADTSE